MHRLMPHKIKGEGHFSAVFKKIGIEDDIKRSFPLPAKKEMVNEYRKFEKENLNIVLDGVFVSFGDYLYLMPDEMISLDKIKCVRPGLLLGEVRKGRFIPGHHLCMALKCHDFKRTISADEIQLQSYFRGEAISGLGEKGYGAVLYDGKYPVGWYKLSDGQAKNHYPKYLRKV